MYYKIRPRCGCTLDPDEKCDCKDKKDAAPAATGTTSPTNTYLYDTTLSAESQAKRGGEQ